MGCLLWRVDLLSRLVKVPSPLLPPLCLEDIHSFPGLSTLLRELPIFLSSLVDILSTLFGWRSIFFRVWWTFCLPGLVGGLFYVVFGGHSVYLVWLVVYFLSCLVDLFIFFPMLNGCSLSVLLGFTFRNRTASG